MCEPKKPAPPVTKIRISLSYPPSVWITVWKKRAKDWTTRPNLGSHAT